LWGRTIGLQILGHTGKQGVGMSPEAVLGRQIERYRMMTGEERLRIALDLHEFSCEVAREGIRHQFPEADETEIERRLRERLRAAYR
jgi:hypothetical protein